VYILSGEDIGGAGILSREDAETALSRCVVPVLLIAARPAALKLPSDQFPFAASGGELTYTCTPPGSGVRAGIDRDEDGVLDGDEEDAGAPAWAS